MSRLGAESDYTTVYGRVLCRNSTNLSAANCQSKNGILLWVIIQEFLDQNLLNIKWKAMCFFNQFYLNRNSTDKVLALNILTVEQCNKLNVVSTCPQNEIL